MKDKSLKEIAKKVVDSNYFVLIAVWIIMCIVFTKLQSNFFSYRNMLNILTSGSLVGLLCIGEAYLIIAGMIELSAGAVAAFSGVLAAILARDGLPLGAILPITIAGGLLFGLLNGLLVTKIKLQPFITTLATMSIARGLAYIICQVKPVRIANESLNAVGSLQVLTVPLPVLILVVLIAVFGILLAKTEFGRNVYLVGGNPEAARLAGINVNKIKVQLFMISGAIAALGGVILAARMNSGQPGAAANVDTDAITAVVLGGIAIGDWSVEAAESGTMFGTFLGLLVLLTLNNGLLVLGVTTYWQNVAKGVVLVFALALDFYRTKRRNKVKEPPHN